MFTFTKELPNEKKIFPTRKNLGTTKYPQEHILKLRNTHEKKFWTHEIPMKTRWHDGTTYMIACNPANLAHPPKMNVFFMVSH